MGRRRLGIAAIRLHLHAVDQVGKFDRVLDEENRNIVADQVPVAAVGIELDREAAHVTRGVDGPGAAGDGRKTYEDRAGGACLLKDRRGSKVRAGYRALEQLGRASWRERGGK